MDTPLTTPHETAARIFQTEDEADAVSDRFMQHVGYRGDIEVIRHHLGETAVFWSIRWTARTGRVFWLTANIAAIDHVAALAADDHGFFSP